MAINLNISTPNTLPSGLTPLPKTPAPVTPTLNAPMPQAPQLTALRPIVTSPREQRIQFLQQQIQKEQQPGPPKPGFWHRLGRIAAGIGNVAGDVFDPAAMELIPGTQLHNQLQLSQNTRELAGLQAQDLAEQKQSSMSDLQGNQAANEAATAAHTQETTEEMPQKAADTHDLLQAQIQHYEHPAPTSADLATYQSLVGMGMKPSDALAEVYRDKALALKPAAMQSKAGTINGQPAYANYNGQTGRYTIDGRDVTDEFKPTPNYGQLVLPTRTATFIGKDGLPKLYQWDPATQAYDKPVGMSASNAYGHEAGQAGAVYRAGNDLIGEIAADKDLMGNPQAIIKSALLNTPWSDPKTARLRSAIATFAALQPSMHGFKGNDALRQFEKILGGIPNNPDALIAAIQGIQETAHAVNPNLPSIPENGASPADALAPTHEVSLKAAMALPQNKGKTEAQVRADIEKYGYKVVQ